MPICAIDFLSTHNKTLCIPVCMWVCVWERREKEDNIKAYDTRMLFFVLELDSMQAPESTSSQFENVSENCQNFVVLASLSLVFNTALHVYNKLIILDLFVPKGRSELKANSELLYLQKREQDQLHSQILHIVVCNMVVPFFMIRRLNISSWELCFTSFLKQNLWVL